MWLYMGIYGYMDIFNHKGIVKLLKEGLPGIHQRFIPKKRFVCSREGTKRFLRFIPGNGAEETFLSKLHACHRCSENLVRFWNLLIDRPGLVKNLKAWWKPGEFPKPGESLKKTMVNFQNLVKNLVNFQKLGELLVILKTWWKPGENLVNLQNRAMNAKTWWKLGENPVKSWWIHQVFTKQTKEAFYALKDSDKTLVASHTRNSIVKTFVAFQN